MSREKATPAVIAMLIFGRATGENGRIAAGHWNEAILALYIAVRSGHAAQRPA
jgi:hypothetical protein